MKGSVSEHTNTHARTHIRKMKEHCTRSQTLNSHPDSAGRNYQTIELSALLLGSFLDVLHFTNKYNLLYAKHCLN